MIQYNKTLALQAIIHLFGEEGAQIFKKSAVDLNSAFYPQPAFYSQSAVCILHSVCILPLVRSLQSAVRSLCFTLTGKTFLSIEHMDSFFPRRIARRHAKACVASHVRSLSHNVTAVTVIINKAHFIALLFLIFRHCIEVQSPSV